MNLLAAYNATHDPDLTADAGWVPTLRGPVDPAEQVPAIVTANGGRRQARHLIPLWRLGLALAEREAPKVPNWVGPDQE